MTLVAMPPVSLSQRPPRMTRSAEVLKLVLLISKVSPLKVGDQRVICRLHVAPR